MIIFIALLLPLLLLCAMLALGHYEDHVLKRPTPARHARSRRHLRVVPGSDEPFPSSAVAPADRGDAPTVKPARRARRAA